MSGIAKPVVTHGKRLASSKDLYFYIEMDDISARSQRAVAVLESAIACDTSYPPGENYAVFADLMEHTLAPLGGTCERISVPEHLWRVAGAHGERVNLIVRPGLGTPDLPEAMIYVHSDTAPAGDGWRTDPFRLTVDGDRLAGRGAADMKGTVAAILDAMERLAGRQAKLAYRPVIAFCTDEEGGRYPGIRYLADRKLVPPVVINLNGSAEPRIWAGCLGSLSLQLVASGRSAHSGSGSGINAFEELIPAFTALSALASRLRERVTDLPPHPAATGPLTARLSITAVEAGQGAAAIPGTCSVTINRRYLPEEPFETVSAEIRETLRKALASSRLTGWRLDEIGHLPPVRNRTSAASDRWDRARAKAFAVPLTEFQSYGSGSSSDFGWLTPQPGGAFVLGGLARPDRNVHAANEFTTYSDIFALSHAIELFFDATFPAVPPANPTT